MQQKPLYLVTDCHSAWITDTALVGGAMLQVDRGRTWLRGALRVLTG